MPWLWACATTTTPIARPPSPIELRDVPFFPQTQYQCGPAALATLLANAGANVTADDLTDEVYVAGLQGSLQAELLGATRRHGFIPYVLAPDPAVLSTELASGRPVLVLQNLGLPRFPVWHYAVVVGLDDRGVILRSGADARHRERARRFMRSWQGGSNWAFVALAPGELAASATAESYVRALSGAQRLLLPDANERAFTAGLTRWPDDPLVLFASATFAYESGNLPEATTLYRKLLARAPRHAAARNNLANALAARGCRAEALREARRALEDVGIGDALYPAIQDTVAEIEQAIGHDDEDTRCD